jgi:hypothetical protein
MCRSFFLFPLELSRQKFIVRSMFVRFARIPMIIALVAMLGAHWAVLQSIAWTTMLANHLCQQSVAEAVIQTFDGQHPCPLCEAIAAGKKSEKKTEFSGASQKLEFPPAADKIFLIAPVSFRQFSTDNLFAGNRPQKPPFQPPRPFFV